MQHQTSGEKRSTQTIEFKHITEHLSSILSQMEHLSSFILTCHSSPVQPSQQPSMTDMYHLVLQITNLVPLKDPLCETAYEILFHLFLCGCGNYLYPMVAPCHAGEISSLCASNAHVDGHKYMHTCLFQVTFICLFQGTHTSAQKHFIVVKASLDIPTKAIKCTYCMSDCVR